MVREPTAGTPAAGAGGREAWRAWMASSARSWFPVAVVELDGRFDVANPAFESLVLRPVRALRGTSVTDIWTLDGLFGPDSDLVPRLEADGAVTVVAEPAPGISAPAVFLRLVLLGGQDGTRRQIGIQVVEREVAEHGRDLSRAAEGLRLAFHQLHAGMLIMSIDGQILDVNAALCRMVDRSREEILVMDAFALTHPEDRPGDIDLGIRALGGETQGWTRRKRFVRSDGDQVEVIETVTLVRDDEGSPVAFVTQVTDLRELA